MCSGDVYFTLLNLLLSDGGPLAGVPSRIHFFICEDGTENDWGLEPLKSDQTLAPCSLVDVDSDLRSIRSTGKGQNGGISSIWTVVVQFSMIVNLKIFNIAMSKSSDSKENEK